MSLLPNGTNLVPYHLRTSNQIHKFSSLTAYLCHLAANKEDITGALDPWKVQQKSVISRLYLLSNFPFPYPTALTSQPDTQTPACSLSLVPSFPPALPSLFLSLSLSLSLSPSLSLSHTHTHTHTFKNKCSCGDHFVMYKNIESLYCTPETNIIL